MGTLFLSISIVRREWLIILQSQVKSTRPAFLLVFLCARILFRHQRPPVSIDSFFADRMPQLRSDALSTFEHWCLPVPFRDGRRSRPPLRRGRELRPLRGHPREQAKQTAEHPAMRMTNGYSRTRNNHVKTANRRTTPAAGLRGMYVRVHVSPCAHGVKAGRSLPAAQRAERERSAFTRVLHNLSERAHCTDHAAGPRSGPACASFWRTCLLWVWFIYPASWRGGREEKSLCTLLAGAGERLLPTTPTPPAANARSA